MFVTLIMKPFLQTFRHCLDQKERVLVLATIYQICSDLFRPSLPKTLHIIFLYLEHQEKYLFDEADLDPALVSSSQYNQGAECAPIPQGYCML